MRKYLFGLLFLWTTINAVAQYNYEVVYVTKNKISLASAPFRMDSWQSGDQYRYSYDIPFSIVPEILISNIFSPDLTIVQDEYGYYDTSGIYFLDHQLDLTISKYGNELEISFYTALNDFDTLRFKNKLEAAIKATPANEAFVCENFPEKADSLWSDELKEELMNWMLKNNVIYPWDAYDRDQVNFTIDKNGVGIAQQNITYDSINTYQISNKFPVMELNGKPVAYKAVPLFLYEKYFEKKILRDIKNDSSNVVLIDKEQNLYYYDLGYAQIYSSWDQYEFGEYLMIELDKNGDLAYRNEVDLWDLGELKRELYNEDAKPDFVWVSDMQWRGSPPFTRKTIFYKDKETWKEDHINYTTILNQDLYELFEDRQAVLKVEYEDFGFDAPPDSLLEDWSLVIFTKKYNFQQELIYVSKKITDPTSESENKNAKPKKKYQYEYKMYSLFNPKLNYTGKSKSRGEKALKAMKAHIEYYKANPDKLSIDLKNY